MAVQAATKPKTPAKSAPAPAPTQAPKAKPKAAPAPKPAPAPAPAKAAPPTKANPKPTPKAEAEATPEAPAKPSSITKAKLFNALGQKTDLTQKQVVAVFAALTEIIGKELGKKGPGIFVVPGLLKLKSVRKPATKARQGMDPFTKQPKTFKAKPARNVVKAVPLKGLKALV